MKDILLTVYFITGGIYMVFMGFGIPDPLKPKEQRETTRYRYMYPFLKTGGILGIPLRNASVMFPAITGNSLCIINL
jgi:hypothetical protein